VTVTVTVTRTCPELLLEVEEDAAQPHDLSRDLVVAPLGVEALDVVDDLPGGQQAVGRRVHRDRFTERAIASAAS
jgi:hypothetical protein